MGTDEISEFLPEETSEDAQAALTVPLISDTMIAAEDLTKLTKTKVKNRKSSGNSSLIFSSGPGKFALCFSSNLFFFW